MATSTARRRPSSWCPAACTGATTTATPAAITAATTDTDIDASGHRRRTEILGYCPVSTVGGLRWLRLTEQGSYLAEVGRLEPLGEAAEDVGQRLARLVHVALLLAEASEARGGP